MRFLLTALLGTSLVAAQAAPADRRPPRRFYTPSHQPYRRPPARLTIGLNLATYNGDLTGKLQDNTLRPGVNLGMVRPLSPHLTFGLDLAYFQLKAVDHYPERGLRFEGGNGLLAAFLRYNILADKSMYLGPNNRPTTWQPFLQAGAGVALYNPRLSQVVPGGTIVRLAPEGQGQSPSFSGGAGVFPVGGGVSLRTSRSLYFTLEGLYYFTTSDQFDGVSQRANPKSNDDFVTVTLKMEYAFYKKKGKPLVHFD